MDPFERMLALIANAFDRLGIPYLVGGSVASSLHGIIRMTQDADFVADLRTQHVAEFASSLEDEFYVDIEMIHNAVSHRDSFNVILKETMDKADIFIMKPTPHADEEMKRRQLVKMGPEEDALKIFIASPEDTILHKLLWYKMGGGISDRQWGDVMGVLKVQAEALDYAYMRRWAKELEIGDLLERAIEDAGVNGHPAR